MPIEFRTPTEDDFSALLTVDGRAFHTVFTDEDAQFARQHLDLERFLIATDGSEVVAVAGSHALELTLPGGGLLPMSGVTWVGVAVTHRRRGILRRLMTLLDEQASTRAEPILGLGASEGGIYGRFGYGAVNRLRQVEINRQLVVFRDRYRPETGEVRLLQGADGIGAMSARWDPYRRGQHGELGRSEADLRFRMHQAGPSATVALHADGYVAWTSRTDRNGGLFPALVDVVDFCASTPEAFAALWHTVLSLDLVGLVTSVHAVSDDDLLPSLLENPRLVRTVALRDNLWLKIADPVRSFAARTYRTDDRLVLGLGPDSVEVTPEGCVPVDAPADLIVSETAVGPLLMGGVSATSLARAGRLRAVRSELLGRADAFFGFAPLPITRMEF